jgi:ElaA protein
MNIQFKCVPFQELSTSELYEIMALRQEVFIVEQNCPYLDADGKDRYAWHLLCRQEDGKLIAYTRLLPKGISYPDYPSIGRVVNSPEVRGQGVGIVLMEKSIALCRHLFGNEPIKIGAQRYLKTFYEERGFVSTGEEYLEDGIPHLKMIRPAD